MSVTFPRTRTGSAQPVVTDSRTGWSRAFAGRDCIPSRYGWTRIVSETVRPYERLSR
jgi:hypothetical protein